MKKIITLLIALVAITSISCDALHTVTSNSVSSQGSPYELIVVCDQREWDSPLGSTLRNMFDAEIPYLAQSEPYFSMFRVTQQSYNNLILKHRNIVVVNVNATIQEPAIVVQYNQHATPQIVMTMQGGSIESLTEYITENRDMVMQVLEKAERDRDIAYGEKFSVEMLDKLIDKKFDIGIKIPKGYTLRNELDDFVWLSYEFPTASQGLFMYSYPSQGNSSLKLGALVEARNRYAALIPGPSDGSYMSTYMEVDPEYRIFRLNGRLWAEMRGLWRVEGDYMGGPFVSYSTIDVRTNRVLTLDCYVYSPKLGKRNFLRSVEHILYNVNIPTAE